MRTHGQGYIYIKYHVQSSIQYFKLHGKNCKCNVSTCHPRVCSELKNKLWKLGWGLLLKLALIHNLPIIGINFSYLFGKLPMPIEHNKYEL